MELHPRHVTPRKSKFFGRCDSRFSGVQIRSKIKALLFQSSDENLLLNVGGAVPAATRKRWSLKKIPARSQRLRTSQIFIASVPSRLHENFSNRKKESSDAVANECCH